MRKSPALSARELREAVDYCQNSGFFRWKVNHLRGKAGERAGTLCPTGYRTIGLNYKRHLEHRLAWLWMTGCWPSDEIDHINGCRDDNRFANLREATRAQNACNRGSIAGSKGLVGVRLEPSGRWSARIKPQGNEIHLGVFDTAQQAHEAYVRAAAKHFGAYARAA